MITKLFSLVALAITTVPCVLFFCGVLGQETMQWLALTGTILWFAVTPLWMGKELKVDATEVEI